MRPYKNLLLLAAPAASGALTGTRSAILATGAVVAFAAAEKDGVLRRRVPGPGPAPRPRSLRDRLAPPDADTGRRRRGPRLLVLGVRLSRTRRPAALLIGSLVPLLVALARYGNVRQHDPVLLLSIVAWLATSVGAIYLA